MSETAINQASAEVTITDNRSIRLYARELLKGQWNRCALLALVYIIITGVISAVPRIGGAANFIIGGPMTLGLAIIFLKISRKQVYTFEELFSGFNSFVPRSPGFRFSFTFIRATQDVWYCNEYVAAARRYVKDTKYRFN